MTAAPETIDTQHHFLTGLAQQGQYAHEFARAGQTKEALEHLEAIERMVAAYRIAAGLEGSDAAGDRPAEPDTLAAWLSQRFDRNGPDWDGLSDDDKAYWEHQARAVRRAVARGGFKAEGASE